MPSLWDRWRAFSDRVARLLLAVFGLSCLVGTWRLVTYEMAWWLVALSGGCGVFLLWAAWRR